MTNQAAQTMPLPPPAGFIARPAFGPDGFSKPPGMTTTDAYTADQMHQYARDYAAALSQTAGVADGPLSGKYGDVLRPFVIQMERELHANAGKGDRPGWLKMRPEVALLEIYYHLAKLQKAVKDDNGPGIIEYAADVANMSMMLLDICGGLALIEYAAQAASGVHPDALQDGTLSKSTAKRVETLAASGGDISHVTIDFPQVGTAGPFKVIDGRMTLPDVTMNDLIHHARMGYVPASNPPASASVSERARHIEVLHAIGSAFDGIPEPCEEREAIKAAVAALEQALTQQREGIPQPQAAAGGVDALLVGDMLYRINSYCLTGGLSDADFRSNAEPILEDIRGYLSGAGYEIQPEQIGTTPQPSAEAVRELVNRWRDAGNACVEAGSIEGALANNACADELESLLSGGSHA